MQRRRRLYVRCQRDRQRELGGDALMPSTFSVDIGENVVVAEVFYDYQPFLFEGIFQPAVFRHASFTRPRGSLLVTDPGC